MSTAQQVALQSVSAGGSIATALAPASLVPVIGPIIAGVGAALTALFARKRPRQKREATRIVDELEPLLRQNRDAYLAGPRTPEAQAAALDNFDRAWAGLVAACNVPELGPPGQWCIQDRARGGKFDWFRLYRDPIAQTPPDIAAAVPWIGSGSAISPAVFLAVALIAMGALL